MFLIVNFVLFENKLSQKTLQHYYFTSVQRFLECLELFLSRCNQKYAI